MGARLATHTCGRPDPSLHANSATQRHASRTQRDTTRTRQTGVRKPTSLLLVKDRGAQWQQGCTAIPKQRPSGPRARPTTTPTLMACGFRTREGAGLRCSFTTYLALQHQHGHATCNMEGGGCACDSGNVYMPIAAVAPPTPVEAPRLTTSLGLWVSADPPTYFHI